MLVGAGVGVVPCYFLGLLRTPGAGHHYERGYKDGKARKPVTSAVEKDLISSKGPDLANAYKLGFLDGKKRTPSRAALFDPYSGRE